MPVFDELLVKVAKGETLTPQELEQFGQEAKALGEVKNAVKSWLQPGSADPKFGQIHADGGEFVTPPMSGAYFEYFGTATIANNTDTVVTFDDIYGKPTSYRVEGDKFYTLVAGKFYFFAGVVEWEANATGRRSATISAYDQNGVLQWGQLLHTFAPHGTAIDDLPFVCPLGITFDNAYLQFSVYQDSGGGLDLQHVTMGIFEFTYGFGESI